MNDQGGNYSNTLSKHAASHAYDGFDPLPSSATAQVGDVKMAYGVLATLLGANPGWKAMDGTVTLPDGTTPPDMRDRVAIGAGTTYALGATGGSATMANHVVTQPNNHSNHVFTQPNQHTNTGSGHIHTLVSGATLTAPGGVPNVSSQTDSQGLHTHDAHSGGGVDAHSAHAGVTVDAHGTNLQPYAALYFLIYVGH